MNRPNGVQKGMKTNHIIIIFGMFVALIGMVGVAYSTTHSINELIAIQDLIAKKQIQLTNDIAKYGFDIEHIAEDIRSLQIRLEVYRQPIYPYRSLGAVVAASGALILGVGVWQGYSGKHEGPPVRG